MILGVAVFEIVDVFDTIVLIVDGNRSVLSPIVGSFDKSRIRQLYSPF